MPIRKTDDCPRCAVATGSTKRRVYAPSAVDASRIGDQRLLLFAESFHAVIDFTDCLRIAQHPHAEKNLVLDSRAIIAGHKVERSRSATR
jgi:hypothetical protein